MECGEEQFSGCNIECGEWIRCRPSVNNRAHTHIHIRTYTHAHTYTYIHRHVQTQTHTHTYSKWIYTHTHMQTTYEITQTVQYRGVSAFSALEAAAGSGRQNQTRPRDKILFLVWPICAVCTQSSVPLDPPGPHGSPDPPGPARPSGQLCHQGH